MDIPKIMEFVSCNLCQSQDFTNIYDLPDLLLERKNVQTHLVKCNNCGLIYQNPRPTIEEMGMHYPPEYDPFDVKGGSNSNLLFNFAVRYGLYKRRRYVTKYKQHGKLLDIGCATGTFLNSMKQLPNWELFGVEINEYAAQAAKVNHHLNIHIGTLENANYPDKQFDAITLWDVLEHLHDPTKSLKEIFRILKPGGVLVLRVPNADSIDARIFGPHWVGLDAPRHLFVFNKQTLSALLDKTGFKILEVSCGGGSYPALLLSVRFWLFSKGFKASTRQAALSFLYNPIVRLITAPTFWFINKVRYGPIQTVVATK